MTGGSGEALRWTKRQETRGRWQEEETGRPPWWKKEIKGIKVTRLRQIKVELLVHAVDYSCVHLRVLHQLFNICELLIAFITF